MDNNNSLPYGAISSNDFNQQLGERHFVPEEPASARDNASFNPLNVARNVHLQNPVQNNRNTSYHLPTRHSHSPSRNGPYRIQHINCNTNIRPGQNLSPSLNLSDSNVPSIIDSELIPCTNDPVDNSQIGSTSIVNGSNNRYFHPPWSTDGRVQADRLSNCGTAHLPIIREEGTANAVNLSVETSRKHTGLKRRVSRDDADDGLPRPQTKHLLTEEKMAAKMHNLSISNDHCYHINGLQTSLNDSNISFSSITKSDKDTDEHKEDDNNNMESGDVAMFVLAPGVKEALAKNNQLLPQSIIDHMSKPCLAVVPWTPQDEMMAKMSMNFNKTDDEKAADKHQDYFRNRVINDSICQTNVLSERVVHTEAMDDLVDIFEFDEDDMDL